MVLNGILTEELVNSIADAIIKALESRNIIGKAASNKTAFERTEALLYNYNGFKKVIDSRNAEVEYLREFGVPENSKSITSFGNGTGKGIVLDTEKVENAVRNVQSSVQGTVQAVYLINKCLETLKKDMYYDILVMYYFEGRTMEDIGVVFKCSQPNITYHRKRLVKELSLQLFPDLVVSELMN